MRLKLFNMICLARSRDKLATKLARKRHHPQTSTTRDAAARTSAGLVVTCTLRGSLADFTSASTSMPGSRRAPGPKAASCSDRFRKPCAPWTAAGRANIDH